MEVRKTMITTVAKNSDRYIKGNPTRGITIATLTDISDIRKPLGLPEEVQKVR